MAVLRLKLVLSAIQTRNFQQFIYELGASAALWSLRSSSMSELERPPDPALPNFFKNTGAERSIQPAQYCSLFISIEYHVYQNLLHPSKFA